MNGQIKLAVPSVAPGGLKAACSEHFGHCDCYTLIDINGNETVAVEVIPNHHGSGCGSVVNQLSTAKADAIMVKGIGRRPLIGFQQVGIKVYQGMGALVDELVEAYCSGKALVVEERDSCQGGGGGNHRHGHGHENCRSLA